MAKMINILGKHRRCHIFLMALALFVALAAGCSNHSSNPPTQTTLPLVIISDVHFTPFYDTAIFNDLVHFPVEQWASIFQSSGITDLSSWGHETNYLLLIKVLDAAQKAAGDGHVLLFSGDILAHKFPETFFALYGKEDEEALHAFIYKTVVFSPHKSANGLVVFRWYLRSGTLTPMPETTNWFREAHSWPIRPIHFITPFFLAERITKNTSTPILPEDILLQSRQALKSSSFA